ncbi:MAG: SEC-C metal-binding domain-containing protein, partial [Phycisphaerae bacterium]|nr:SEC-C metal-binding domain-containing protein [Phycisphaerae bacterium]
AVDESELLSAYLTHVDANGQHHFPPPPENAQWGVWEGQWNGLTKNPNYLAKKAADKVSYLWDHIIEEFTQHTLNGTHEFTTCKSLDESESGYRILAAESRFSRRRLSNALGSLVAETPDAEGRFGARTVLPDERPEFAYVFVALPQAGIPEEKYREYRRAFLEKYCLLVAWKNKKIKQVVGLATEACTTSPFRSHDLIFFVPGEWTDEAEAEARQLQDATGLLTKAVLRRQHEDEYPEVEPPRHIRIQPTAGRVGRNEPCPCGSGRKFKKCCGHL